MATTLTKPIGTVTLTGAVEKVTLPAFYGWIWIRNMSDGDILAGLSEDISEGADGVMVIPAGDAGRIQADGQDSVYLLGTGNVLVVAQNYADCPFKASLRGGDPDQLLTVSATGSPVTLNGLQGGVPFSEMVVSGKNLIHYPYKSNFPTTQSGITATDDNGIITVNGTVTSVNTQIVLCVMTLIAGTYTLSGCPNGGGNGTYRIRIGNADTGEQLFWDIGDSATFTLDKKTNIQISVQCFQNIEMNGVVFRPQLELSDTPTAYEPPITGRELTVNVSGKNLLTYPYNQTTKTVNGITFTDNGDGSVTVKGAATARSVFWLKHSVDNFVLPRNKQIYISAAKEQISNVNIGYGRINGTEWISSKTLPLTGAVDAFDYENFDRLIFNITVDPGSTVDVTLYPQLEIGDTATPYEPYHGSTTTITPDSNPYVIPNDIRQQDGLNNISVSEGEISVVGVRKNAAIKRIWDEIDEIKTAIIVSNGETE